jgi:hypothetical protein
VAASPSRLARLVVIVALALPAVASATEHRSRAISRGLGASISAARRGLRPVRVQIVWCAACGHQVKPDTAEQARCYGEQIPILEWREAASVFAIDAHR